MNKAAQALGRLAAGKPKNYSKEERALRAQRLAKAREKRWPDKCKSVKGTDDLPSLQLSD